jgi:hypothetical protein
VFFHLFAHHLLQQLFRCQFTFCRLREQSLGEEVGFAQLFRQLHRIQELFSVTLPLCDDLSRWVESKWLGQKANWLVSVNERESG